MSNPLIPSDPTDRPGVPQRQERPDRDPAPRRPDRPRPDEPTQDNAHTRGDGSNEHPT